MNAATLRASARCSRFQEVTPGGTRPFVGLLLVEDVFDALRGDGPTARRLVGRLRDEAKGCAVLRRWLLAIADVFEAAVEFSRELLEILIKERRAARVARERFANDLLRLAKGRLAPREGPA